MSSVSYPKFTIFKKKNQKNFKHNIHILYNSIKIFFMLDVLFFFRDILIQVQFAT